VVSQLNTETVWHSTSTITVQQIYSLGVASLGSRGSKRHWSSRMWTVVEASVHATVLTNCQFYTLLYFLLKYTFMLQRIHTKFTNASFNGFATQCTFITCGSANLRHCHNKQSHHLTHPQKYSTQWTTGNVACVEQQKACDRHEINSYNNSRQSRVAGSKNKKCISQLHGHFLKM